MSNPTTPKPTPPTPAAMEAHPDTCDHGVRLKNYCDDCVARITNADADPKADAASAYREGQIAGLEWALEMSREHSGTKEHYPCSILTAEIARLKEASDA